MHKNPNRCSTLEHGYMSVSMCVSVCVCKNVAFCANVIILISLITITPDYQSNQFKQFN